MERARMATAPAARGFGAEPARVATEPRTGPAQGADILHHQGEDLVPERVLRVRDSSAIPDPLGGEALQVVMEVYGWLSWATSETTRGMQNRSFKAVLLRRDGGNQEVPLGSLVALEDQERVLRAVIWTGWPDRGLEWPAFLERGGGAPCQGRRGQCIAAQRPAHHP